MKFKALRSYIKSKNLQKQFLLQKRDLVIDADCYFKDSYKNSGCQFLLGADCDTYSDYLVNHLISFIECDIKCYFIFKGTTNSSIDRTKDKHQRIVNDRINIDLTNSTYFEPLLVKDVEKQVLEVLGLKYFCCEYDSMDSIIGVARQFKCPVLTDKLEYCLFGVSCILPNLTYKEESKELECVMYGYHTYKAVIGLYNKVPILLTLLNENVDFLHKLPPLSHCAENLNVLSVIRWIKRQRDENVVAENFVDGDTKKSFLNMHEKFKILYLYPSNNLGVKYFRRRKPYGLFKDDKKWFGKGVSNGKIAVPHIDMKRSGFITGSTVINDVRKPDALLAASQIIGYTHCLLINSQNSTLSFIGRKDTNCSIWKINTCWGSDIHNRQLFRNLKKDVPVELFSLFFKEALSEFDLTIAVENCDIPEDCHMLVITLVYYIHNINKAFTDGAYFILLSYLMLGPVSRALYKLKKNEKSLSETESIEYKECQKMYDGLKFLYKKVNSQQSYNVDILHSLAEFQHCLQHMNYLNTLCGTSVTRTMYHDTLNATFIYNTFVFMKNKDYLISYLESNFKDSWPFKLFTKVTDGFESCCKPSQELKLLCDYSKKPLLLLGDKNDVYKILLQRISGKVK